MSEARHNTESPLYKAIRAKSQVFFEYRGFIEQGDVLEVSENDEGQKVVHLVWLEGYKSRNEQVALSELLAVVDVRKGKQFDLDNWTITGFLLPAGEKWLAEHVQAQ